MVEVYLGLGSNLGDREKNIAQALELLGEGGRVVAISPLYETDPVGLTGPLFLNAVGLYQTELGPHELLSFIKGIEARLGRKPAFFPRPIDIDILVYGELAMKSESLTIPHPRLLERAFVLVPLAELAPELVVPGRGERVSQLLARVGREGVRRWAPEKAMKGRRHV
ncbi:MAG: 2-amino-4-hydroxy-6-hydroxymethyldihydropteridine diphosphokinase [Chloroflexi bacterium]|nr:2-amino-4-hydroxy-6-hydroxymethyldihydropteridine diphosphokinase [Chloroflexota bacterium]